MIDPLLSICIPTRNQANELRETLNSLLPQMVSGVELIISDNSSDEATNKLINEEFKNKNIRYFRDPDGIGVDKSLLLLTERARAKYVWWIGDDVVESGAVDHVLRVLRDNAQITFLWVNFRVMGQESSPLLISDEGFFNDNNEVLEQIGNLITFISSGVFAKAELDGLKEERVGELVGSACVNTYIIMHVLAKNKPMYKISYPYIQMRMITPDRVWFDEFRVFAVTTARIIQDFRDQFSTKSVNKILMHNFRYVWKMIISARARGEKSRFGSKIPKAPTLFKIYWRYPEFWLVLPLLLAPRFILKLLYWVYKKFKK